jgi:beta-galactosidase
MLDARTVDVDSTNFGIRKIEFRPDTGFWLNGKNVKILGVCIHEDGGAVGEAVPRSVYEERFAAMKALGANAIRLAHNPPNPVELDVCDHLGLLVMDEMFDCWTVGKPNAEQGYNLFFNDWSLKDLHDAVMRDRNHPSIILWSAGNEIHDTPQEEKAKGILKGLVAEFHELDPSRPVTQALFRPNTSHDYTNGLADMLDVIGTNYRHAELEAALEAVPTRTGVITEEGQDAASWIYDRDHPRISGCFIWAGIDYLGEARAWPNFGSGAGLVDRTLLPKANGFQRDSWWNTKPVVHLVRNSDRGGGGGRGGAAIATGLADWTPQNPAYTQANVTVYSNCDEVELFLNGTSLGAKPRPEDNAAPRVWNVEYAPGTLRAVGRNNGQEVASDELRTAGPAAKVVLTSDQTQAMPDFDDVVFVRATITDAQGVRVPTAQNQITFTVSGPGEIVATDNGSNTDHTVFSSPARDARDGNCLALVRATGSSGKIVVTASVDGLPAGTLTLAAVPVKAAN